MMGFTSNAANIINVDHNKNGDTTSTNNSIRVEYSKAFPNKIFKQKEGEHKEEEEQQQKMKLSQQHLQQQQQLKQLSPPSKEPNDVVKMTKTTTSATATATASVANTTTNNNDKNQNRIRRSPLPKLWSVIETDQFFYHAALGIVPIWFILLIGVYILSPSSSMEYLQGSEQAACMLACGIFATSILLTCIPLIRQRIVPPATMTTTTTLQQQQQYSIRYNNNNNGISSSSFPPHPSLSSSCSTSSSRRSSFSSSSSSSSTTNPTTNKTLSVTSSYNVSPQQQGGSGSSLSSLSPPKTIIPTALPQISGILLCSLTIQTIAMITNGLLAFCPVPVLFDPITNARVFLIRWCEWIPLSGLMTCLTEGVDIVCTTTKEEEEENHENNNNNNNNSNSKTNHKQKKQHRKGTGGHTTIPILLGIGQAISCIFGGIIPPLCPDLYTWCWSMAFSFLFFVSIFPRLYYKYQRYHLSQQYYDENNNKKKKNDPKNSSSPSSSPSPSPSPSKIVELENYNRIKSGYQLLLTCCMCWTVLVLNYFIVMWGMRNWKPRPQQQQEQQEQQDDNDNVDSSWWSLWLMGQNADSMAMISDTIFDVLAKCVYMNIIQVIHESTFDAHGRIRRQLEELRNVMTTLWENSTDVMVISTVRSRRLLVPNNNNHNKTGDDSSSRRRREDRIITLISPTFTSMVLGKDVGNTEEGRGGKSGYDPNASFSTFITSSSSSSSCLPVLIVTGTLDPMEGLLLDTKVHPVDVKSIPYPMMDHPALSSLSPSSSSSESASYPTTAMPLMSTLPLPDGFEDQFEPHQRERLFNEAKRLVRALYHPNTPTLEDPNLLSHEIISVSNNNNTTTNNNQSNNKNDNDADDSSSVKDPTSTIHCELKLTQMDSNVTIATVRDVTERYRRFEAERRALVEALARRKDAQSVNRFTRHEVKNGLLAGIEMCDYLRNASDELKKSITSSVPVVGPPSGDMPVTSLSLEQRLREKRQQDYKASSAISRQVQDLEGKLHKTLDTVLAEAMARDVVHGKYRPKLEPVDVFKLFSDFSCAFDDDENTDKLHFKVHMVAADAKATAPTVAVAADTPPLVLSIDPQLLKCIHRNAISSAIKSGTPRGVISTKIRFLTKSNTLEVDVVSTPGPQRHNEIIGRDMTGSESTVVQGRRLHPEVHEDDFYEESGYESGNDAANCSGDRAWIMQECAKTLGGVCAIRCEQEQTIVSFSCPAIPQKTHSEVDELESVPPPLCTWGIGIDDAAIQRKILTRILSHMGIDPSKSIVFGKTPEESEDMIQKTLEILEQHPGDYVLLLVDENLDYDASHGRSISGSKVVEELRAQLTPSQESRLLALIRSANDSTGDLDSYKARAHGFFPKSTMRKEDVNEILTPIWRARFPRRKLTY